jgi:heat shock protein HslJ
MLLTVGGEVFEMRPVEAASGTRYEAMNDPTTTFWNKGDRSTITVRGRTLPECGRGSPVEESAAQPAPSPLQGTQWVVQDIGGTKVLDTPQVTLAFGSDGRVSGKSSCNSYTGQYALSGEGMTVSELTSTLMACDDPRMEQEKKFLDVVRHASRFEIGADGALILHTADGRKLTARRI